MKLIGSLIIIFSFFSTPLLADHHEKPMDTEKQDSHEKGKEPKKRPPKEALKACKSKKEGDSCQFKGREGKELSGECFRPKAKVPLACRPKK